MVLPNPMHAKRDHTAFRVICGRPASDYRIGHIAFHIRITYALKASCIDVSSHGEIQHLCRINPGGNRLAGNVSHGIGIAPAKHRPKLLPCRDVLLRLPWLLHARSEPGLSGKARKTFAAQNSGPAGFSLSSLPSARTCAASGSQGRPKGPATNKRRSS